MNKSRPLIAVVDDEESIRRALQRLIKATSGMDAEVFSSGAAFLDSLKTRRPDCVLLDLHMPGMSGFEVQARLTQTGQNVPVIAFTGHDLPGAESRIMAGGAWAYLHKPVNAELLLDTIRAAIAAAPATPQAADP